MGVATTYSVAARPITPAALAADIDDCVKVINVETHGTERHDNMRTDKQLAGDAAESLAIALIERAGLRVLERNYRVRGGEIDCVALDGDTLVFVEVRFRKNQRFGGAAASIDQRKQQRIIHAAQIYLMKNARQANRACRFDCVVLDALDAEASEWIKDAFQLF